jgi:hypothetical protein
LEQPPADKIEIYTQAQRPSYIQDATSLETFLNPVEENPIVNNEPILQEIIEEHTSQYTKDRRQFLRVLSLHQR